LPRRRLPLEPCGGGEQTPAEFSAFTSKYDAFLRGRVQLTPQQSRGLAAFNDPARGNCFHCHRSQLSMSGTLPMFTDYGFVRRSPGYTLPTLERVTADR
jgi:cytochrome c peroxidase